MASLLRLHVDLALAPNRPLELPAGAVRHVQVRRLQPGDTIHLFDGRGHEVAAKLVQIGRSNVSVCLGEPVVVRPELAQSVTLAVGVPTNERMDSLVEKATELGVARIQPLTTERSVLRLADERARRRVQHWAAVASAAAEQCGRATVPTIADWQPIAAWLATQQPPAADQRWLLSLAAKPNQALGQMRLDSTKALTVLSGPEGGLTAEEEQMARSAGYEALSLGPRVLRADTAPLALMAWISLQA